MKKYIREKIKNMTATIYNYKKISYSMLLFLLLSASTGCDYFASTDATQNIVPLPEPSLRETIKKRGELRVLVRDDMPPFGFINEKTNKLEGFDIDIAKAVARALDVRFVPVPIGTGAPITMLREKKADMIAAAMVHSFTREKYLDFSITYFMDGIKIAVPKGSDIHSIAEISGADVGVIRHSHGQDILAKIRHGAVVHVYGSYPEAFLALKAGKISVLCAEATILLALINADARPGTWQVVGDYISNEPIALGLPENESSFRDFVNKTLNRLWVSGEYMNIYNRWFGPDTAFYLPTTWRMEVFPGHSPVKK